MHHLRTIAFHRAPLPCRRMRFRFAALAALLVAAAVLGAAFSPRGARAAADLSHGLERLSTRAASLSTPELIEQAYAQGAISAEQRLLYLAYAVFEPESLPLQFHSSVPWYGTAVVAELNAAAASPSAAASSYVQSELDRLLSPAGATVCSEGDGPNSAASPHFFVNYGTVGGGLTFQDYLDSLETTYATEVLDYGWPAPPFCQAGAGSCSATNPWNKYPVQIADLGNGLYGYATIGGDYGGVVGDNPNSSAVEANASASCLVLNSDYTGFGDPQTSLDATTAHEFVHALQYATGDLPPFEDDMWYEATATYMEDEVFDAANDNYNYLWPEVDVCLGEYTADPYANWIFPRYAAEHNGGTNTAGGGEDVIQSFWANVAAGQSGLAAFNAALASKGANLPDTFHNYAIASRFSLPCTGSEPFCFEEGAGYVAAAGALANHGQIAAVGGSFNGSLQNNYAANWIGLPTSGAYSVKLKNLSAAGQFRASVVAQVGSSLAISPLAQIAGSNQEVTLAEYRPPAGATKVVAVITNQQQTADDPDSCAANAYRLSLAAIATASADLSLSQQDAPDPVTAGSPLTYTLVVANRGPLAATAVRLTDTLPSAVTFASATATQGTCAAAAPGVVCNLGSLASGAIATVTLVVTPTAAGTITNQADVIAAEADPDSSNNSASAATTVSALPSGPADLSVTLVDAGDPVYTGEPITYSIAIGNAGPETAVNARLAYALPAAAAFVSADSTVGSCSHVDSTVACNLGDLAAGSNVSVTLVLVAAEAGTLTNTVTITGDGSDPDSSNNTASEQTTARLRQLYLPAIRS